MIEHQLNGIMEKELHMFTKHITKLKTQNTESSGE